MIEILIEFQFEFFDGVLIQIMSQSLDDLVWIGIQVSVSLFGMLIELHLIVVLV